MDNKYKVAMNIAAAVGATKVVPHDSGRTHFRGILNRPLPEFMVEIGGVCKLGSLAGNGCCSHLFPVVPGDDYSGTILQECDILEYRGLEHPGRLLSPVKMKLVVDSEGTSLGYFWDLPPWLVELNFAVLNNKDCEYRQVPLALERHLDSSVISARHGLNFSRLALRHDALELDEIGVTPGGIAAVFERTGVSLEPGQWVWVQRFPLAFGTSAIQMKIRLVDSPCRGHYIHHDTMKEKLGGDFDIDVLFITPPEGLIRKGKVGSILPAPVPPSYSSPYGLAEAWETLSVQPDGFKGFPQTPSDQLAEGLMVAKLLQGTVTNGCERFAACAATLDEDTLRGIGVSLDPGSFVSSVTKFVKNNFGAAFEITQDFRKYPEGDPERYEKALQSLIQVFLGNSVSLDPCLSLVDKDGMTIDPEIGNGILQSLGHSLIRHLQERPVLGSTVGTCDIGEVARVIARYDVKYYLDILSGAVDESPIEVEEPEGKTPKGKLWGIGPTKEALIDLDDIVRYASRVAGGTIEHKEYRGEHVVSFVFEGKKVNLRLGNLDFKLSENGFGCSKVITGDSEKLASYVFYLLVNRPGLVNNILPGMVRLGTIQEVLALELAQEFGLYSWRMKKGIPCPSASSIATKLLKVVNDLSARVVSNEESIHEIRAQVYLPPMGVMKGLDLRKKFLKVIGSKTWKRPYSKTEVSIEVGMTSKSKPGSFVTMKTGKYPGILLQGTPWVDILDRQFRETFTLRFAKQIINPYHHFSGGNGKISKRSSDIVWAFIDEPKHGDMGWITPYGLGELACEEKSVRVTGLSEEKADEYAREVGATDYTDLERFGYEVTTSQRPCGTLFDMTVCEQVIDIVHNDRFTPSCLKAWMCGHKFMAHPTDKDVFAIVDGEKVPISGLLSLQSMIGKLKDGKLSGGKKMVGSVACGVLALHGKTFFPEEAHHYIEEAIQVGEFKEIVDNEGTVIGKAIVGIFRTYVLMEDERNKETINMRMPKSVQRQRMVGESIKMNYRDSWLAEIYSRLVCKMVREPDYMSGTCITQAILQRTLPLFSYERDGVTVYQKVTKEYVPWYPLVSTPPVHERQGELPVGQLSLGYFDLSSEELSERAHYLNTERILQKLSDITLAIDSAADEVVSKEQKRLKKNASARIRYKNKKTAALAILLDSKLEEEFRSARLSTWGRYEKK